MRPFMEKPLRIIGLSMGLVGCLLVIGAFIAFKRPDLEIPIRMSSMLMWAFPLLLFGYPIYAAGTRVICPQCGERINHAAQVCPFCHHAFASVETRSDEI